MQKGRRPVAWLFGVDPLFGGRPADRPAHGPVEGPAREWKTRGALFRDRGSSLRHPCDPVYRSPTATKKKEYRIMPDGGVGRILIIPQKKNIAVMIFRDNCKPLRVTPHHVWGQSLRLCGVKASASASTSPRSLEPRGRLSQLIGKRLLPKQAAMIVALSN